MTRKLIYIGAGIIPGIPGRDLSDEEVEKHGGVDWLVATGLWKVEKPKRKTKANEVNDGERN